VGNGGAEASAAAPEAAATKAAASGEPAATEATAPEAATATEAAPVVEVVLELSGGSTTETTSCWPGFTPLTICVRESPRSPTTTCCWTVLPF
jgi:hypothetical protein